MVDTLAEVEKVFQALADRTRLRILALLVTGEVCVCHIHESLGLPQPKVSRHLAYLRRAGIVEKRKAGQWAHYRLAGTSDPVLQTIHGAVRHALWHVDAVREDGARLATRQACAQPSASSDAPACACCAERC